MTISLRICLIIVSVLTMLYMMKKIRQSKLQIEYSVFWIVVASMLIVFSVFPKIVYLAADLVGIKSPANLIFVFIIFVLLLKIFMMTLELSHLENKVKELIQHVAIKEQSDEKTKED